MITISESLMNMEQGQVALEGYQATNRNMNPLRARRVFEAGRLWAGVIHGEVDPFLLRQAFAPTSGLAWQHLTRYYPHAFNETMTTSDFSALTVDVLDRMLWANYIETPMHYTSIAKKATLRDFRPVKRFVINGAEGEYTEVLETETAVKQRAIVQPDPYTYTPTIYAGASKLSWKSIINDDLGIFQDLPARLARGGRRTIEKFVTRLYVGATGPDSTFFSSGNANIVTGNPALSVAALATALKVMYKQVDYDGEPIEIENLALVVPPALYVTAMNIMNQLTIDMTDTGGTSNQRVRVNNWIISGMQVVKNPQIPRIATSGTYGDTSWFMFADPRNGQRPALEVGFLQGFDTPQLFQKAGNMQRIGGAIDASMGDFSSFSTELKSVLVHGGTQGDPKMAVASAGQ